MRKARIQIAKPKIIRHFDGLPVKVFRLPEIAAILDEKRDIWKLPTSTTIREFIRFLIQDTKLSRHDFPLPYRSEHRYTWGDVPTLELYLDLKSNAYFSHHTAMWMNEISQSSPELIYLNHEQQPHSPPSDPLAQNRIDAAFARPPRVSKNIAHYHEMRICLINGMHTGQLGVVTRNQSLNGNQIARIRVTNIERTLIDITVRPAYSGGTSQVLDAFRKAKGRFSTPDLAETLKELNYTYPYHQAIGFYLDRAGYNQSDVDLFRILPRAYDFYLSHRMTKTKYIREWNLYIPKDFP